MIKVGIYGPAEADSPLRKQLLRLLLRHPDVDLRTVAAPGGSGHLLSDLYPVYTGETELRLEAMPDLSKLDVLFVIDEDNLTSDIQRRYAENADFKVIVLGDANQMRNQPGELVYGFAEHNRKTLVRGARAAISPSPLALLIETALFPLAKGWHLPEGEIFGTVSMPKHLEVKSEPEEARAQLATVQENFAGIIRVEREGDAPYQRMDLTLHLPLTIPFEEVEAAYAEAYEDHNFAYVIPGKDGVNEDMRGSNKCLLQLYHDDTGLCINATADYLTRGNAGNAVHLMNLLFGLHERTGLNI